MRLAVISDVHGNIWALEAVLRDVRDDDPCPHVMAAGSPEARYALCERGSAGWTAVVRLVRYDHSRAAATARRNGREDWARALETGLA